MKMNQTYNKFLNRHKKIKHWVHKYRGLTARERRKFIILPIIIVLLASIGRYISKPTNLAVLPNETGVISNVESFGGFRADIITFSIGSEQYCCRVPRSISADIYQNFKRIESQRAEATIYISKHPVQYAVCFPHSMIMKRVVHVRCDEIVYDVEHHNYLILGQGIVFYVFAALCFLYFVLIVIALVW